MRPTGPIERLRTKRGMEETCSTGIQALLNSLSELAGPSLHPLRNAADSVWQRLPKHSTAAKATYGQRSTAQVTVPRAPLASPQLVKIGTVNSLASLGGEYLC